MLTIENAADIVRNCIRKLTGVGEPYDRTQRLGDIFLTTLSSLTNDEILVSFKSALVREALGRGYSISENILGFDLHFTVADICDVIFVEARGLEDMVLPSAGESFLAEETTKPVKKGGKKKKAVKKVKNSKPPAPTGGGGGGVAALAAASEPAAMPAPATMPTPAAANSAEPPPAAAGDEGSLARAGGGDRSVQTHDSDEPPPPDEWKHVSAPTGAEAGSPQQAPTRTVECTPQLEIRKELVPAKAYLMALFVDQGPAPPGAEVQPLKIEVPRDMKQFPVDVWLDCSSHFSLDEVGDPPRITVKTDTGVSDEMGFTLKVLKAPDDKPMFVSAFFRYNERPCGKINRYLELAGGSLRWKDSVPRGPTEGEVVLPNADAPPSVVVETDAAPADIRIEVLRILDPPELDDGRHFKLKCYTGQGKWEGMWTLPEVTKDLVKTFMKNFMSAKGNARITSLKAAGLDFWDKVPVKVRDLLWNALDEKGARTMSVISEEPYIPWELMVPYKTLEDPRKPLGVELQLGRWITGNYKSAPQHIPMKSAYIISPKTSGLASAALEVAFLTQQLKPQFDPGTSVSPTTFDGLDEGLAGPPRNVVHFVCHGKSAALQTLDLDTPDTLDCSQVRAVKGFLVAFKGGPLAFLNACEVGGQVPALDGVGGFANSFIQLGASAVVAPLWAVQDKAAFCVTQTFYPQALKGVPFAKIMQQIRTKAYDEAIDSYAAYCFYGDPMASATPN